MARIAKVKLSYPQEYYMPELLRQGILTPEQMKAEYTRLRNVANKRLLRMQDTRFENYQSFQQNVGKFIPVSQISSERELIYRLSEVERFISAKTSTISGIRDIERRTLESLQDAGYTFVNAKNLAAFGEFMAEYRAQHLNEIYDSDEAYKLFVETQKRGIRLSKIKDNFDYWMEQRDTLADLPVYRNKDKRGADFYRNMIENRRR